MKYKIAFVLCALNMALPAHADVTINTTGAAVQFAGTDGIQINNFTVPGFGNYSARFIWSPQGLGFVYDPSSLVPAGQSSCIKQIYAEANASLGAVQVSTRTINGVEFGGLIDVAVTSQTDWTITNVWNFFTIAWARTSRIEDNPYLKGQTVANYSPDKAYGFVSTYNKYGFSQNDLVEIGGNPQTDAFLLVKQVNGNNSYSFSKGARKISAQGCVSGTGSYMEHTKASSVVVAGDTAAFVSAYNTLKTNWSISTGVGVVAASSDTRPQATYVYGGLIKNDPLIVHDIGNGFTMVAVVSNGKVVGSFVTMTQY